MLRYHGNPRQDSQIRSGPISVDSPPYRSDMSDKSDFPAVSTSFEAENVFDKKKKKKQTRISLHHQLNVAEAF